MKKIWLGCLGAFIVLAGSTLPAAALAGPPEMPEEPELEEEFVKSINAVRKAEGLAPVTVRDDLDAKAQDWAEEMARDGKLSHSDVGEGLDEGWWRVGENVGRGGAVNQLTEAFMASPTHRKNLTDPDFDLVGVGVVRTPDGYIYVAQEFMDESVAPQEPEPRLVLILVGLRHLDGAAH